MSSPKENGQYQLEALLSRLGGRLELFPALQKMVDSSVMVQQTTTPIVISRLCAETTKLLEGTATPESLVQLQTLLRVIQNLVMWQQSQNSPSQSQSHSQQDGFMSLLEPAVVNMISDMLLASLHAVQRSDSEITDKLYEELLETINAVADYSQEAKSIMARYFCDRLLHVVIMPKLRFTVRMETLKRLNLVLERCSLAARDMLEQNPIHRELLLKMARTILSIGDYEFQVAIIESLLRFTPKRARKEKASKWFPEKEFSKAFLQIRDSEFETDCRRFLNNINKMLDDKAMVVSIPCLTAHLGEMQLQKPEDENYGHFWVDFNLGSKRITMFCEQKASSASQDCDENLWETVSIWDEHVSTYVLEDHASIQRVELHLITNARHLISFGPQFTSKMMVISFARQQHILPLLEKTFGKAKSASHKKQTKISAVEEPIHVHLHRKDSPPNIPETIVEEGMSCQYARDKLHCSQSSVGGGKDYSCMPCKVSVPAEKMCVPSLFCSHSAASPRCQSRERACQELREKQVLMGMKTKASGCPVTPKSRQGIKRVKTPLRLVQPVVDSEPVTGGRGQSKVSVPVMSPIILTHAIQEQVTISQQMEMVNQGQTHEHQRRTGSAECADEDMMIPSSVPDEQILVVPDSQYLLPKRIDFPALRIPAHLDTSLKQGKQVSDDSGVSMDTYGNVTGESSTLHSSAIENTDNVDDNCIQPDPSQFLPKNTCKVSLTPALSTVTEESITPGTGRSIHKNLTAITEEDPMSVTPPVTSISQMLSSPTISAQHCSPRMSPDSTQIICAVASLPSHRSKKNLIVHKQVKDKKEEDSEVISSGDKSDTKKPTKSRVKKAAKNQQGMRVQRALRSRSKVAADSFGNEKKSDMAISRAVAESPHCQQDGKLPSQDKNCARYTDSNVTTHRTATVQSLSRQQPGKLSKESVGNDTESYKSVSKTDATNIQSPPRHHPRKLIRDRNQGSDGESYISDSLTNVPASRMANVQSLPSQHQRKQSKNTSQGSHSASDTTAPNKGRTPCYEPRKPLLQEKSDSKSETGAFQSTKLGSPTGQQPGKKLVVVLERSPLLEAGRLSQVIEHNQTRCVEKGREKPTIIAYPADVDNQAPNKMTKSGLLSTESFYSSSSKKTCYEPRFFKSRVKCQNKQTSVNLASSHMYDFESDNEDDASVLNESYPKTSNGHKKNEIPDQINSRLAAGRVTKKGKQKRKKTQNTKAAAKNVKSEASALCKKRQALEKVAVDEDTFLFSLEAPDDDVSLSANTQYVCQIKPGELTGGVEESVREPSMHSKSKRVNKKNSSYNKRKTGKTNQPITANSALSIKKKLLDFENHATMQPLWHRKQKALEGANEHVTPTPEKLNNDRNSTCTSKSMPPLLATVPKQKVDKAAVISECSSRQSYGRNLKKTHQINKSEEQPDSDELNIEDSAEEDQTSRCLLEENGEEADVSTNMLDGDTCLTSFAEACKGIVMSSGAHMGRNRGVVNYTEVSESETEIETPAEAVQKEVQRRALRDIDKAFVGSNRSVQRAKKKKRPKKSIFSETDETADTRSEVSWLASTARKKKPKLARDYTHHHPEESKKRHEDEDDELVSEEVGVENIPEMLPPTKPKKGSRKQKEVAKTPTHPNEDNGMNLYYQPANKRQRLTSNGRSQNLTTSKTVHTHQIQVSEQLRSPLGTPLASKNFFISHSFSTHDQTTSNLSGLDTSILKTPATPAVQRKMQEEPLSIERFRSSSILGLTPRAISPIMPLDDSQEPRLSQPYDGNDLLTPASGLTLASDLTELSDLKTPKTDDRNLQDSLNLSAIDAEDLLVFDADSSDILLRSGPCERRRSSSEQVMEENAESNADGNSDEEKSSQPHSATSIRPRRLFNSEANTSSEKKRSRIPIRKPVSATPDSSEQKAAIRSEEDESGELSDMDLRLDISAEQIETTRNSDETIQSEEQETEGVNISSCPSEELLQQNMDLGLEAGVSTIIKSFGAEIQRNVMLKKRNLEDITKDTVESAECKISTIWRDQQLHREKTVGHLKESVMSELEKMQKDIEGVKESERQVMAYMVKQQKLVESCRITQKGRLHNLKMLQMDFAKEMGQIDSAQQQQQGGVRGVLKKEIDILQKKLMQQTQQQEIHNMKRSLQMLFV